MKKFLCFVCGFIGFGVSAQYISVDENRTTIQLVNDVLINSPCGTASNIAVTGWDFGSGTNSFGYFNANGSIFPFADGVVLTTGKAAAAVGPNVSILSDGPTNWNGDQDLEAAVGVNNTINATVLEFDFLPTGNFFTFNYIFSSEQYLSSPSANQCGYTDGFAFLLKKANTADAYQNLAVVPNTSTPVTVNTVRGPGTICPTANEEYFDAFNDVEYPTNYNGQTKPMRAMADVEPGVLYHIKIVVADLGNNLYDSAIFLEGGSFKSEKFLGADLLISNALALCPGKTKLLDATMQGATSYQWYRDNVALAGETNPTYTVTAAGTYSVEIQLSSGCDATGEIKIEYYTAAPYVADADLTQCDPDNDGQSVFNLSNIIPTLTNANSVYTVTFYRTTADADAEQNPITNPISYDAPDGETVIARLRFGSDCYVLGIVHLHLAHQPAMPQTITICDTTGAPDGIAAFNFTADVSPLVLANMPPGMSVAYYATIADALAQTSPLPNNFTNTAPYQQIVYARVYSDGATCYDLVSVTLNVTALNPPDFGLETVSICAGTSTTLSTTGTFYSYLWSTGATTPQITVSAAGNYTLTVSDANGCTATKQFTVTSPDAPVYASAQIGTHGGSEDSITVVYSGNGEYEFSVDGQQWQTSPVFENLEGGNYEIYIRDVGRCTTVGPYPIFLIAYPPFFTPNGDGINDTWEIKALQTQPTSQVRIFDRYGKPLYEFFGNQTGWNGKYGYSDLPSTDYWFTLQLADGRNVKGHFAMKR
jgi:gliding motility-associated-like protein